MTPNLATCREQYVFESTSSATTSPPSTCPLMISWAMIAPRLDSTTQYAVTSPPP